MKITPTIVPTAPRVETALKLPVGRIIEAIVGQPRGNNLVELNAGRLTLLAESTLTLRSGDKIQLRVEGQDAQQRTLLRVLTPAASEATAQLKTILPKQESAAQLLAQLSQVAGSKPVSAIVQQAIATLDKLPARQQLITAEALKTVLQNSGLFLEAKLSRGEAPRSDIKAELLRLVQTLQNVRSTPAATTPGSPQPASANAAAAQTAGQSGQPPAATVATAPGAAPQQAAAQPAAQPGAVPAAPAATAATAATPAQTTAASAAAAAGNTAATPAPTQTPGATAAPGTTPAAPGSGTTNPAAVTPGVAGNTIAAARSGNTAAAGIPAAAATNPEPASTPRQTLLLSTATGLSAAGALHPAAGAGALNPGSTLEAAKFLGEYLRNGRPTSGAREPLPGQAQPLGRGAAAPVDIGNIGRLIETLLGQTESTLARLESTQLLQVQSRDGQLPQWLFEIPVRDKDGVDILKLAVEREPRPEGKSGEDQSWHITLSFDFPTTGPVIARVTQTGSAVDINFFAASSTTYGKIAAGTGALESILQRRGISDLAVKLQHGLPENAATSPGLQSMLDDSA